MFGKILEGRMKYDITNGRQGPVDSMGTSICHEKPHDNSHKGLR